MGTTTKAIYVSYWAARHAGLRGHVLELLEETELNAVIIDIKGEDGLLYDTFTQPTISDEMLEAALKKVPESANFEGEIDEDESPYL